MSVEQATQEETLQTAAEANTLTAEALAKPQGDGATPEAKVEGKTDELAARIKELEASLESERQGRHKDAETARSQELALLRQEQRDELQKETRDHVRLLTEAISPLLDTDGQMKLRQRQSAMWQEDMERKMQAGRAEAQNEAYTSIEEVAKDLGLEVAVLQEHPAFQNMMLHWDKGTRVKDVAAAARSFGKAIDEARRAQVKMERERAKEELRKTKEQVQAETQKLAQANRDATEELNLEGITASGGAGLSDAQVIKLYGEGKFHDHQRAQAARKRLGYTT